MEKVEGFTPEVSPLELEMSDSKLYIIVSSFWRKPKCLIIVLVEGQHCRYEWWD